MQSSRNTPAPLQSTTQRGIDTKLIAAVSRLRELETAYYAGQATRDELLTASEEVRQLRAVPMASAIDAYFAEM
jgi:hypothetical protein